MAQNRTIGRDGTMPWQLPADLQRFRRLTMGQTLLMGRKTYQSIGRQLPGRETIVVSRNRTFSAPGCQVVGSLAEGIAVARSAQLFICGGEEIYRQALPQVERIYLTELLREVEGDTFLPELPPDQFQPLHSENYLDNGQPCRFTILQRLETALAPEKES